MISSKKRKKKFLPENFLPSKGFVRILSLSLKSPGSLFEEVQGVFYLSIWIEIGVLRFFQEERYIS